MFVESKSNQSEKVKENILHELEDEHEHDHS